MNKKVKRKQLRNKNGITLIALVVTIIVLIILAAVSLSLVLGDNGIITKARDAVKRTEESKLNEEVATNELMEQLEGLIGGNSNSTKNPGESGYPGGNYDDPYIPIGFTHTEGSWNGGYTIKETTTGNEFVWVPCVTDLEKIKSGDYVQLFKKTIEGKYGMGSIGLAPTDTSVIDEEPTDIIRASVGTYGGFYIAKYEAGVPLDEEGNEIAPTLATTSQKPRSVPGAIVWTNIFRGDAIIAAENMIDASSGVKSGLISGECWDTTLQWIVNTSDNVSNKANMGYDLYTTGKGWYSDISQRKITTTGYYKVNNICDMAGNAWEWTTENSTVKMSSNYQGIYRGGSYESSSSAASRKPLDDSFSTLSFRVILYKCDGLTEERVEPIDPNTLIPSKKSEIEQYRDSGIYMPAKTILKDSNDNLIVVPEGFKIAEDSGKNVTEGIVIEDNDIIEGIGNERGNQYVWIPVGENIIKANGETINIKLGRYVFADGTNHKNLEGTVLAKGTPILKQSAENYEDETGINIKEIYPTATKNYEYKELKTNRPGKTGLTGENATALDLKGFVDSVKANGGYYIARYEASYGADDEKANSKVSTGTPAKTDSTIKTEGMLWNYITEINAAKASRDLYNIGEKVTVNSDLINSYAWDTTIVYIQEFSEDRDYSKQNSKNGGSYPVNTGTTGDEICKINDMASNACEWTTEYSTYAIGDETWPTVPRGGYYSLKSTNTDSYSYESSWRGENSYITFRYILYM